MRSPCCRGPPLASPFARKSVPRHRRRVYQLPAAPTSGLSSGAARSLPSAGTVFFPRDAAVSGLPCPRHRRSGKIGPRGFLTHRHVVVWPADWTVNRKLSSWVFGLNTQRFGNQRAPRHRSALAASVSRKPDPSCFPGGISSIAMQEPCFWPLLCHRSSESTEACLSRPR